MEQKYKSLQIKSVRFYQSVEINKAQEIFIVHPDYKPMRQDNKNNSKLSLSDHGLIIENDNDYILVSWNNISSIHFDKSESVQDEPQSKSSKPKNKKDIDFRDI